MIHICENCRQPFQLTSDAPLGHTIGITCPECGRANLHRMPGTPPRKLCQKTQTMRHEILKFFHEMQPRLGIRQTSYHLSTRGIIPKSEAAFRAAQHQMKEMRRLGILPYGWVSDNSRWYQKPRTYRSLRHALEATQRLYRRDLWADSGVNVEIWIEKAALTSVVSPVTDEYDVPLYIARGFSSDTFIFDAAEEIKETGCETYIYQFGDYDYYGVHAAEKIAEGMQQHGADVHFERVAITPEQIEQYGLLTRAPKDKLSKAKGWARCCELDALPPDVLRDLVRACIERHIDRDQLEFLRTIEEQEKETLATVVKNFVPVQ